jgi:hemolysin activation/secretion protein
LRYQLLNTVINLRFLKFKQFNKIPLALYPNFFADMGYVHNRYSQENKSKLANRILAGTGIGLDIVTYYNLVVKFSYAMNDLKQKGFIFNIGREF